MKVMTEVGRQQDNPSRDWKKADARIWGQILWAQNVVYTLPDTIRVAEFYAQILISIPGIAACRVCLGGKSVQAGEMAISLCAECETPHHLAWEDGTRIPSTSNFKCNLADQPGMRVIAIDSDRHRFGFFVFKINPAWEIASGMSAAVVIGVAYTAKSIRRTSAKDSGGRPIWDMGLGCHK